MEHIIPTSILQSEREFFDREAAGLREDLMVPADQIERYRRPRRRALNVPKDGLFADAVPLEGKRVLDYGCGSGTDACILAACGAQVTAFDVSPQSLAVAEQRAQLHGLSDRIHFDLREAGNTGYPPGSFDIIVGDAILHHLHMALPAVYAEIDRLLTPTGTAYFIEPVANSLVLRALRRIVPVKLYATPDERQLVYKDFEPLRQYFSKVEILHYHCLERLYRVLGHGRLAARVRKTLRWLDYQAQRLLPFVRRYYGLVLVIARR